MERAMPLLTRKQRITAAAISAVFCLGWLVVTVGLPVVAPA
jgi:hypothetical protein